MSALPDLTTVSALEVRLKVAPGSLSGVDLAHAQGCIADASALVRAASGRDWSDEDGAPAALVTIATLAALRAYRNPDGVAGENFGVYSYTLPQGATGVGLTSPEVATCERLAALAADYESGGNFRGSLRIRSAYEEADE